ncbi:hypothetical protein MPTP_0076 [Melissococcus plutonius ATCC 35311]|uniref:Uncharacterized protein n=1 Tax=Melissococcus plutonius (strain ATCC 35311 / DSM 29964 / CIP 104052 / LMG 20360 / NCIMB 702443) TaxID=940190 RepID=F3Y7U7_MELPT|nr:hypothetical protein MPTP_0076 [Melissococcus plutonius ATCC 35311]BAL61378.1 hypothetical protein MPD5_0070 [Melissococcus plutonius DAT561]
MKKMGATVKTIQVELKRINNLVDEGVKRLWITKSFLI